MDDNGVPATGEPSPVARKRTVLVASAVALLVVLSVGGYLTWRAQAGSPAEAVTSIASAAMKGDADSVAASIDTTSLVDSAVDEVFSSTDATSALVAAYMKKHPDATKAQVKAKLRTTLDEEIREHVKSGTLPKRIPLGSDSLKSLVAGAAARGSIRSVKVDGNIAHVVVSVPYKGKTLTVKVRMRHSGSGWKVDRIENMASVLRQAGY